MMSFLETGRALYLLAAICLGGIMVRLAAGSFYKRLIRESSNLALAKNRYLRALRQNAEDTYRTADAFMLSCRRGGGVPFLLEQKR